MSDMKNTSSFVARSLCTALVLTLSTAAACVARAQEAEQPTKKDSVTKSYPNAFAGEFTPGNGYDIIKTAAGSLNISVYGLFRYMNQYPVGASFTDHLGRVRPVQPRND